MRFFHRKQQCYIVGEGSFTGEHGHLPEIDEDQDSIAQQMLQSTMRRKSSGVPGLRSSEPTKLKVRADMEPSTFDEGEQSLLSPSAILLDSELKQHSLASSGVETPPQSVSLTASPERTQSLVRQSQVPYLRIDPTTPRDHVVSEDGKL